MHNKLKIIICALLSVIGMVELCLTGDIFVAYRRSIDNVPLTISKYDFRFHGVKQDEFEGFEGIYDRVSDEVASLYDVAFSGMTAVQGAAVSKYNIVTYYPECTDLREIDLRSGETPYDIGAGELFVSDNISYQLSYSTTDDGGTNVFFNGSTYSLKGTGYILDGTTYTPDTMEYANKIFCNCEEFFNITKRVGGISFQFQKPLTAQQENDLLNYMNENYEDVEYTAPVELPEEEKNDYTKQLIVSLLIIIVCVISCFELMEYYYMNKQIEYGVFRICGASVKDVLLIKVKELIIFTFISFITGSFLYVIVSSFLTKMTVVSIRYWYFYILNMVFFVSVNAVCFLRKGTRI